LIESLNRVICCETTIGFSKHLSFDFCWTKSVLLPTIRLLFQRHKAALVFLYIVKFYIVIRKTFLEFFYSWLRSLGNLFQWNVTRSSFVFASHKSIKIKILKSVIICLSQICFTTSLLINSKSRNRTFYFRASTIFYNLEARTICRLLFILHNVIFRWWLFDLVRKFRDFFFWFLTLDRLQNLLRVRSKSLGVLLILI